MPEIVRPGSGGAPMRILLLCSAFNGLSQRVWIALRDTGHDVTVELATSAAAMVSAVSVFEPDLVICPFLRERVPEEVWRRVRTIIVHPGPKGDRGPSSLDWAILTGERRWGVTALQAVEEMDAGPIWATRNIALAATPPRKSVLYNGPIADAALEVVHEVVGKAADPTFRPEPLEYGRPDVIGRLRPAMRAADRRFDWFESTAAVLRAIRASDGSPGARTTLAGAEVAVFDAHRGPAIAAAPGTIVRRRHDSVLVRTGDGGVWLGQVRTADATTKLPAAVALAHHLRGVPEELPTSQSAHEHPHAEISYRRRGTVGVLGFDFYNGAMSTAQCRRLTAAFRHAAAQPTRVLVLRGGDTFSNGIHLNVIDAAPSPRLEAWRNINAIDDLCREIIDCTRQLVVASLAGNAGAGGVMLALGADRVVAREGVVLNPHYATMGLFGSEYWTYVLPRRVGPAQAAALTGACLPIGTAEALQTGLVDDVRPGRPADFERDVVDQATRLARRVDYRHLLERKRAARSADESRKPLDAYRSEELAEMSRDIFEDRHGFADARQAFLTKRKPLLTPARIAAHRRVA